MLRSLTSRFALAFASQAYWALEACRCGLDSIHLKAPRIEPLSLVSAKAQSLITVIICLLELIIRRRARSAQNSQDVPPEADLIKGTISFGLCEFVRVHKFSRRLATSHQEYVVSHEGSGVEKRKDSQNDQSQRNAKVVDGFGKGDVFIVHVNNQLSKTSSNQIERQEGGG